MIVKGLLLFLLFMLVIITVVSMSKVNDKTTPQQRIVSLVASVFTFIMTLVLADYVNSIL